MAKAPTPTVVPTAGPAGFPDFAIWDVQFWQNGLQVNDDQIDVTVDLYVFARAIPLPAPGESYAIFKKKSDGTTLGGGPFQVDPYNDPTDPTWEYALVPADTFPTNTVILVTINRFDGNAVATSEFKTLP